MKPEEVLASIAAYKDLYDFAEIVPVSARNGNNTDELLKVIMKYLPYGPQFYDEDTITDQPERQIVAEIIREKALHSLNEEIPHGIACLLYTSTKHYDYGTLFNEINVNTGGIGTSLELYNDVTNIREKAFKATFEIKGKALYGKLPVAFDMMREILMESKLDDGKRIREILAMLKSRLLMKFQSSGHVTACLLYTSRCV